MNVVDFCDWLGNGRGARKRSKTMNKKQIDATSEAVGKKLPETDFLTAEIDGLAFVAG